MKGMGSTSLIGLKKEMNKKNKNPNSLTKPKPMCQKFSKKALKSLWDGHKS